MKSIISGAIIATAIVACLTLNVQARPIGHVPTTAVSDTGKMEKHKMDKMDKMSKMDKMDKMGKMDKMSKMDKKKMKKDKKMDKKMAKDTSGKM